MIAAASISIDLCPSFHVRHEDSILRAREQTVTRLPTKSRLYILNRQDRRNSCTVLSSPYSNEQTHFRWVVDLANATDLQVLLSEAAAMAHERI